MITFAPAFGIAAYARPHERDHIVGADWPGSARDVGL